MPYLLDTATAGAALRGAAGLDSRLQSLAPEDWCISALTHAEMRHSVACRPRAVRLQRYVEAFLSVARTEAWDEACAELFPGVMVELRRRGVDLPVVEVMVAAQAMALGAVLVSDRAGALREIEGLRVENWIRPS
jgi:tRNA(fMet)-specific endonuclease VapC